MKLQPCAQKSNTVSLNQSSQPQPSTYTTLDGWLSSCWKCCLGTRLVNYMETFLTSLFNPYSDKWANWVITAIPTCQETQHERSPQENVFIVMTMLSAMNLQDLMCLVFFGTRSLYLYTGAMCALNYIWQNVNNFRWDYIFFKPFT